MRTKRILLAIFAPAMAGALSVTALPAGASAPAASDGTASVGSVVAGSGAADTGDKAKKRRAVTIKFRNPDQNISYSFTGRVGPKAQSKRVPAVLFRASRPKGPYRKVRTTRTNGRSAYAFGGLRQTGFFKVRVPGTRKFKPGTSKIIRVVRS